MGELKAVLELFRATAEVDDDLHVLCDSQYVINSVVKWMPGWKRKGWRKADGAPVMNVELMKEIDAALDGRRYRFEWVKGHVGHELNEAADERARGAATAYQRRSPVDAGPGFSPLGAAPAARQAPVAARPTRSLTLDLSEDEWRALERRARDAAVSPEALLRSLATGAR
jgi:ribonuclease HI